MVAESEDGLLLDTVQVYSPPVVTVRVCVYSAVSGSSSTVSVPSVTVVESLIQVTVVAGLPMEIQVRVSPVRVKHYTSRYCDASYIVKMSHRHNLPSTLYIQSRSSLYA